MLERDITTKIIAALNKIPMCRAEKLHGGPMTGHQKLDILCCREGRFYYLEVKQPGGKPTKRQAHTMMVWEQTGAVVACVTSVEEALRIVEGGPE